MIGVRALAVVALVAIALFAEPSHAQATFVSHWRARDGDMSDELGGNPLGAISGFTHDSNPVQNLDPSALGYTMICGPTSSGSPGSDYANLAVRGATTGVPDNTPWGVGMWMWLSSTSFFTGYHSQIIRSVYGNIGRVGTEFIASYSGFGGVSVLPDQLVFLHYQVFSATQRGFSVYDTTGAQIANQVATVPPATLIGGQVAINVRDTECFSDVYVFSGVDPSFGAPAISLVAGSDLEMMFNGDNLLPCTGNEDGTCEVGEDCAADCNGNCEVGEAGSTDCDSTCDAGDATPSPDCNCDGDGLCEAAEDGSGACSSDCDGTCDATDDHPSADCNCDGNDQCDAGEDGSGACLSDCDGTCDATDDRTSPDCPQCDGNDMCEVGETDEGACDADCNGSCDAGDDPWSIDCLETHFFALQSEAGVMPGLIDVDLGASDVINDVLLQDIGITTMAANDGLTYYEDGKLLWWESSTGMLHQVDYVGAALDWSVSLTSGTPLTGSCSSVAADVALGKVYLQCDVAGLVVVEFDYAALAPQDGGTLNSGLLHVLDDLYGYGGAVVNNDYWYQCGGGGEDLCHYETSTWAAMTREVGVFASLGGFSVEGMTQTDTNQVAYVDANANVALMLATTPFTHLTVIPTGAALMPALAAGPAPVCNHDTVCDAGESPASCASDCNDVCEVAETTTWVPDCDGRCGTGDVLNSADCDGNCNTQDFGNADCDDVCEATDDHPSQDCPCNGDGSCQAGEWNSGDCSSDCNDVCEPSDDPAGTTMYAVADAYIFDKNPDNANGAYPLLAAGVNGAGDEMRTLVRFDGTALPATVTTANFRFNVADKGDSNPHTYRIVLIDDGWVEGVANGPLPSGGDEVVTGVPATPGNDVTWNDQVAGTTPWAVPGGGDIGTVLGETSISSTGDAWVWVEDEGIVALQALVGSPFSIMLYHTESTASSDILLASREGGATASISLEVNMHNDCDGTCDATDAMPSHDCNCDGDGLCEAGEDALGECGVVDCEGTCEADDDHPSADCNCDGDGVCEAGEDDGGHCAVSDCDGMCQVGELLSCIDCDDSCGEADDHPSVDCACDGNDFCDPGEDDEGDCANDCNGQCEYNELLLSIDCDGTCDGSDVPPSVDCPCDGDTVCQEYEWDDGACVNDCDGVCDSGTDEASSMDCLDLLRMLVEDVDTGSFDGAVLESDIMGSVSECTNYGVRVTGNEVDTFDAANTVAEVTVNNQGCHDAITSAAAQQSLGALASLATYDVVSLQVGDNDAQSTGAVNGDSTATAHDYDGAEDVLLEAELPGTSSLPAGNVQVEVPLSGTVSTSVDLRVRVYDSVEDAELPADPETEGFGRPGAGDFTNTVIKIDALEAGTSNRMLRLETPYLVCVDTTGFTTPTLLYYSESDNAWRNARSTCVDYPIEAAEGVVTSTAESLTFEAPFWDLTSNRLCTWLCHLTEYAVFDSGATTTGDPHFEGFYGGWFDFMGEAGKVFNVFSDETLQVNARFVEFAALPGQTYMGEIGVRAGPHRVYMAADGTVRVPDAPGCVLINPAQPNKCALRGGGHVRWSDERVDIQWDVYRVSLTTEVWTFEHTAAEAHGLGYRMSVNRAALAASGRAESWAPHGVHGQVAGVQHVVVGSGKQGEGVVEGQWHEYEVASGDLFGVDNVFSRWNEARAPVAVESSEEEWEIEAAQAHAL